MMLEIRTIESIDQLKDLKQQYVQEATAPLDGMWLLGFVPMATHYGFYEHDKLIGFYCLNSDGYLLQFYLDANHKERSSEIFKHTLNESGSHSGKVHGAFVSTGEPQYLSLCLDNFSNFQVNSLMYQSNKRAKSHKEPLLPMTVAINDQLSDFVDFAKTAIGAPEEWVTRYFTNLINNQELFGYWENNKLLASGECRLRNEYQTEYADLGMIVSESERGKGLGTKVVQYVFNIAESKGLKAICSTENSNIGAQKTLARAGFFSGNRIIQFDVQ